MLAILKHGFGCRMGQAISRRKPAEPITVLIEHPFGSAKPHPTFAVTLNAAQESTQICLNRLEGIIGIAPKLVLVSTMTKPHLAGMVLSHGIAHPVCRETLFLLIAVEGLTVETDEVVKAKPYMALRILGNAPTLVEPVRRRWLLVVLQVKRDQVVESSTIVISQGTVATTPYTTLTVFVDALHSTACNPIVLQMVEI